MGESELDALGPVDYLVVEFPAGRANFTGEVARELRSLVDRELVRVPDLLILRKDEQGELDVVELHEVEESLAGELRELEADLALLLAEQDVADLGAALEPGSVAAVLVYENRWAGPFGASAGSSWPTGASRPGHFWAAIGRTTTSRRAEPGPRPRTRPVIVSEAAGTRRCVPPALRGGPRGPG